MFAIDSPVHCASFAFRFLATACIIAAAFVLQVHAQEPSRKLLVGTEYGFYPFADVDDEGKPQGFTVDLFEATAREMNIEYEFVTGSWNEILQAIEDKQIDVLPFVKYTERREGFIDFSITHIVEHAIVVKRIEQEPIETASDLSGKDVVVMKSDGPHIYLAARVPEARLTLAQTTGDALKGLAAGVHDYAVVARTVGLVQIRDLGLEKVLQQTGPLLEVYDRGFSFGVQEGDQETLALLNQGLNLVKESGEYDRIYNRWFGGIDPRNTAEILRKRLIYGVLGLLSIALIIGSWLMILRKRLTRQAVEADLRRQVAETSSAMNIALQKKNERLAAYDHTIAHSLKTPLSATGRFLEILVKFRSDSLTEEQRHLASQALSSLKYSEEAVNALLTLSTVSKDQIALEPLDMGALVQQALQQLQDGQTVAQASIRQPSNWPAVVGYAPWIGEVWLNYLSNAFKYSNVPAKIEIGFAALAADHFRFWVRSNGRLLTEEEKGMLFVPFTRLEADDVPGHGLGLTIVQRIIERLGGAVGVNSSPEYGNEFFFDLPAAKDEISGNDYHESDNKPGFSP